MTPQRRDQILAGQTNIARKVYESITADQSSSNTVGEIANALRTATGAGCDIHILRCCLRSLADCGLVCEVVPGSFRQKNTKENKMPALKSAHAEKPAQKAAQNSASAMDVLANIAAGVREIAKRMEDLADEIDTAAVGIEEMTGAEKEELKKLRQMRESFKSLMG